MPPADQVVEDPRLVPSLVEFTQGTILTALRSLGLPLDASLSVVAVEMLPENPLDANFALPPPPSPAALGASLSQVRILRASALTPVPAICPPKVAA